VRCIDDTLITAGIVYREAEAAPVNKKLRLEPFADLRDCASSPASEQELAHIASRQQEMTKYKAMKVPAAAETPLIFWKENAQEFPILSLTARRILCISASSAQSERISRLLDGL